MKRMNLNIAERSTPASPTPPTSPAKISPIYIKKFMANSSIESINETLEDISIIDY